jgi:hypothetical protein
VAVRTPLLHLWKWTFRAEARVLFLSTTISWTYLK